MLAVFYRLVVWSRQSLTHAVCHSLVAIVLLRRRYKGTSGVEIEELRGM